MDLLIPNSWLKKYLDTKATHTEIAKYMSLCGPSIERTKKTDDGDYIYNVEVTTNRVDTASVLGIAREASVILPRFGIPAKLKKLNSSIDNLKLIKKVKYLDVTVDNKLCPRFTAVLIKNVTIKESPKEVRSLLEKVDVRPINNIVDVSNYIMHEIGQPIHTFDYDKIVGSKMILRESKKGEVLITLDNKEFKLNGGDIVIEDGSGKLIDLCGIMGGLNSSIDSKTKNVLLFVQNYNQHKIRKTSMTLGLRSEAAVLFEKGLDSENVSNGIILAAAMIEKLAGGKTESEILDIYPKPYSQKTVTTTKEEIDSIIGIDIPQKESTTYLENLGFDVNWQKNKLEVKVPSWRANDIEIREDIAEEIARIYGYHNLPSVLMSGELPKPKINPEFTIEKQIKEILRALGGIEIYNISLVTSKMAGEEAIGLKNPLGSDTEYLRTSLRPSLLEDIYNNPQEKGYIHFFEVSNIYSQRKNNLPDEKLTLAGIIKNGEYRVNKGIIESLLDELKIEYQTKIVDGKNYLPNQKLVLVSGKETIGEYGNLEDGFFYYEFNIQKLISSNKIDTKYHDISKYPPQVEDLTLQLPEKTFVGEVIDHVKKISNYIKKFELSDIYENSYTFRVEYQDENKTLEDKEVESIRTKILNSLKTKFGINIKD